MTKENELSDIELLTSDIRELTPAQVRRRHDLLKSYSPIQGALRQMSHEQATQLLVQIKTNYPEIVTRLKSAGEAYRNDRDSANYEIVIYDVMRKISSICAGAGYEPTKYAYSELQKLLWRESGLDNLD